MSAGEGREMTVLGWCCPNGDEEEDLDVRLGGRTMRTRGEEGR